MASSRAGMNAGLAWIDGQSQLMTFATVDGQAQLVGQPASVAASVAAKPMNKFDCLAFSPGKDDFTLTYVDETSDGSGPPTYVIAEANEAGTIDTTTTLNVSSTKMDCATVTPNDTEYALAWQDGTGSWLAVSAKVGDQVQVATYPFASASDFGGPDLQPPLGGLAPFGADYGVVLERALDIELWRLDAMGNRKPGALVFPSLIGNLGGVSALPFRGGMVATYSDYSSAPGAPAAAVVGRRLFVDAACY